MFAACSGASHPEQPKVAEQAIAIDQPARGVACDGRDLFWASEHAVAKVGGWKAGVDGTVGPIARAGELVIATTAANQRGEPGSMVVAIDAKTGAERWRRPIDATQWALIHAIAGLPDGGAVIGGSFSGTLRAGARVVGSAGGADGFVARLGAHGEIAWLVRMGGAGDDSVQGVAVPIGSGDPGARAERVVIAGTFMAAADLLGAPLPSFDERSPFPDAFAAELDALGVRRWSVTWGGAAQDAVAGVAIDHSGRAIVAGTARDSVKIGNAELAVHGQADGLVTWISPDGELGRAQLVGGEGFEGTTAIAAVGDRAYVGVFAGGGGYLTAFDPSGATVATWQLPDGDEVTALCALPGGVVAATPHALLIR